MSDTEIPTGTYDCWAIIDPDSGLSTMPISADREGWAQIKISIALAVKGQKEGAEEAFATAEIYQTIDPDAPVRGGIETTPYEFAMLCLLALGAESPEAIAEACYVGVLSSEQVVIVPGVGAPGKKAAAKVTYKDGRNGQLFMNIAIFARRDVPVEARAALAAKFKRPAAGDQASPAAPPAFAPRGSAVGAPGTRPNPFAPRTAR